MTEENNTNEENQVEDFMETRGIRNAFVTPIFESKVSESNKPMLEKVRKEILRMKKAGEGANEYGNFVTDDNLHENKEFSELSNILLTECNNILNFLSVKREAHYITTMWANATNTTHRHMIHTHPNCLLSGIIHIQSPEGAGATTFADPRPGARVIEFNVNEFNEYNGGVMMLPPEEGKVLIWPSWLPHGVEVPMKQHSKDRIVVAFNVMAVGDIDTKTAKMRYN